ncbi:MAG: hypothetical protein WCL30_06460 [Pseudomonadota bacterium]
MNVDILTLLYNSTGIVVGIAFVPQIRELLKNKSAEINIPTWLIFFWCSFISLFYACVHIHDASVIFCSTVGSLGNLTVVILGSLNRMRNKQILPRFAYSA